MPSQQPATPSIIQVRTQVVSSPPPPKQTAVRTNVVRSPPRTMRNEVVSSPPPLMQPAVRTQVVLSPPQSMQTASKTRDPQYPPLYAANNVNSRGESLTAERMDLIVSKFDDKMNEMKNEFQRQIQSLQALLLSSQQNVRDSVTTLRSEFAVGLRNHSETLESEMDTQSALGTTASQTVPSKPKKIYPLPLFTGKPEEWQSFVEAFTTTTNEFQYSNLHNIMRLRDAITGRARETVEALLSNSANVGAIMQVLKETYGRPEQLIKSQIEKVRKFVPLAEDNFEQLISFANSVNNMATFLKNANGEHHLYNPTLLCELVGKLPASRQLQWAEKCILLSRTATILDFSDWLDNIRRVLNMLSDLWNGDCELLDKVLVCFSE